jgi:hypothetical protein
MPTAEQDLHSLETLYLALELRLERQFQDLLARRFPDAEGEERAASLARRIQEAGKPLARPLPGGNANSLPSAAKGMSTTPGTDSLRKQARHLLELIKRNAALCAQVQDAARCGLQELQRGERFLQGVRGYRENQPRFFDSHQ